MIREIMHQWVMDGHTAPLMLATTVTFDQVQGLARTVQFRDGDYARLVDVASQRKLTK
jgi:hypothetical protein